MTSSLTINQRWQLLLDAIDANDLTWTHFIHVPKTAGTSIVENVARQTACPVISIDGAEPHFKDQCKSLGRSAGHTNVFTRAHNTYPFIRQVLLRPSCRLVFSFFREPAEIHWSNASMIMRRLAKFYSGESEDQIVQDFSEAWAKKIETDGITFNEDVDFIQTLVMSTAYRKVYQNIYSQYFGTCSSSEMDRIQFFAQADADDFMTTFFPTIKPKRVNVASASTSFDPDAVSISVSEEERKIISDIKSKLTKPDAVLKAFGNPFKGLAT